MSDYLIGIDGGGTKTLGILWNNKGEEVKKVEYGFANFSVNIELTKKHIEQTLLELTRDLKENTNVIMGIAGVSNLKDKESYEKELNDKYNINTKIESDGFLALHSVRQKNNEPVIMVIGGTGSIVYGLNNNEIFVIGGYGHLMGDDGSAYHLVISSLKQIIKEDEEVGQLSTFSIELMKELNVKDVKSLKGIVYGKQKSEIANHAFKVSSLAEKGNKIAISLLKEQGSLLAKQVFNTYNKMETNNTVRLALRGGFLQKALYVKEEFIKELKEKNVKFIIDDENLEPIMGAYHLKEKSWGGFIKW